MGYFKFLYTKDLALLPHLWIQLVTSVWTHGCLFYTVVYNPVLLYC